MSFFARMFRNCSSRTRNVCASAHNSILSSSSPSQIPSPTLLYARHSSNHYFSSSHPTVDLNNINNELQMKYLSGESKGIVLLSMNRPKSRNALGKQLISEFETAIEILKNDSKSSSSSSSSSSFNLNSRVVVLNSNIEGIFCAGADLKERQEMTEDAEIYAFVDRLRYVFTQFESLWQPVIASMDGGAFGGGLEMALACDLRIGGSQSKYGLTETGLAIIPGAGGTQRLPRLIGVQKAKELIFTSKRIDVNEAFYKYGLLNAVSETESSLNDAILMAQQILKCGPIAIAMAKQSINQGMQCARFDDALAVERECYEQVIPTYDRTEAINAFVEKRDPVFEGR